MAVDKVIPGELGQDLFSQLFAKLHTHLIEGVDIPNDSLGKYFVFIERNQLAEHLWGQFRVKEGICWSIVREGLR